MKRFQIVLLVSVLMAPAAFANNAGGCGDGECSTGTDGAGPNEITAGLARIGGVVSATGVNNPANGLISGHIEIFDTSLSGQIDPGTLSVVRGNTK